MLAPYSCRAPASPIKCDTAPQLRHAFPCAGMPASAQLGRARAAHSLEASSYYLLRTIRWCRTPAHRGAAGGAWRGGAQHRDRPDAASRIPHSRMQPCAVDRRCQFLVLLWLLGTDPMLFVVRAEPFAFDMPPAEGAVIEVYPAIDVPLRLVTPRRMADFAPRDTVGKPSAALGMPHAPPLDRHFLGSCH